jgi:Family of unknown function (DUF6326)
MASNVIESATQSRRTLDSAPVPIPMKLSALWASFMFLYAYVDILAFFKPGTIEDILQGRVWEFDISQGWALGALVLVTIPGLMVFLSLALPARAARWTNVVVAALYVPISIGNVLGEAWIYYYWFGAAVEAALLLLIIRYSWTWPRRVD